MQPYYDAKEFDAYVQESRNEFVTKFWKQWPDAKERVVAENLLICFDQMRDRLQNLQSSPTKTPSSETDYIQLAKAHAAEVHNK